MEFVPSQVGVGLSGGCSLSPGTLSPNPRLLSASWTTLSPAGDHSHIHQTFNCPCHTSRCDPEVQLRQSSSVLGMCLPGCNDCILYCCMLCLPHAVIIAPRCRIKSQVVEWIRTTKCTEHLEQHWPFCAFWSHLLTKACCATG